MSKIHEVLSAIQSGLKAPKNQRNTFGNYNYRNLEDILEALKPLLNENGATLTVSDEPVMIGDRFYIKSTATLTHIETGETIVNHAYAREAEAKKGMDESQITGATSSYSRKYNLNGLFAIDDTKDADATNKHQDEPSEDVANLVGRAKTALDKGDWVTLCNLDRAEGWLQAWGQLDTRKKKAIKELMDKANQYRDMIHDYDMKDDDAGIMQLWEELDKDGKTEVWRRINDSSKDRIKQLKEAA